MENKTKALGSKQNLKKQMVSGTSWQGVAAGVQSGLSSLLMLVLAFILEPSAFGIVGMTDAFTSLFMLFITLGFELAIVREDKASRETLSTLFWVNNLFGLSLTLIGVVISPLLAVFYSEPRISAVFAVLSLTFLLEGLTVVQRGILKQKLQFKKLAIIDMAATVISAVVTLVLAFLGWGYWCLVAQQILKRLISIGGYWSSSSWRPELIFNLAESMYLIKFSLNLLAFNFLNFLTTKSDSILIGRFLGSEQLGYYLFARQVIVKPVALLLNVVTQTLYPVISSVKDDVEKVREGFVKSIYTTFAILAPIITAFAVVSSFFIPNVIGEKWIPAIPVIYVWCFLAVRGIFSSQGGILYILCNRPDLNWKYQLVAFPVVLGGMVVGIQWGAVGTALGYTIAQTIISLYGMQLALKLVNSNLKEYLLRFSYCFAALCIELMVGVLVIQFLSPAIMFPYVIWSVVFCVTLGTYVLLINRFDPEAKPLVQSLIRIFRNNLRHRTA